MITSILDLDLYKLTVGYLVFKLYRNIEVEYQMTVRNGEKIDFWRYVSHSDYLRNVDKLANLSLTSGEAQYLRTLDLFSEDYIQFLSNKPMSGVYVSWHSQQKDFWAPVPRVKGEWCRAMLYEIFCLSIANEMFTEGFRAFNSISMHSILDTARARLSNKIERVNRYNKENGTTLEITEFGTRRRLSKRWQEEVVETLAQKKIINGTSNVLLAHKFGIKPLGTFGHEFVMGMQGVGRIQDSQSAAFRIWLDFWKGKLKIALDDTLGTKKFLRDFTEELAEKYDGLRHDSGDWKRWTTDRLDMYSRYEIDSRTKTLFYSDGLDVDTVFSIHSTFSNSAKLRFGIGTNLTNDSFTPVPQVVMKMIVCNGQPVCKLSNNPDKASCIDEKYLEYVRHAAEKY